MAVLQLEQHFFTQIDIKANPEAKDAGSPRVECRVIAARSVDNAENFQITLTTWLKGDSNETPPPHYSGSIEVVGLFRVPKAYDGDAEKLAGVNGASILYNAVRELVCNLTARGPWPMVTLKTMSFIKDVAMDDKEKTTGRTKRPTRPAAR